jgi:hypothetical protein
MLIPNSDAIRVIFSLEQMIERSDIIAIGTIESTWVDVRPFSDHKIIDTAKISVDEWLKSENNSDTLDIRYYGYWAQTIENVFGVHRMDTPIHDYKTGQKVLIFATYEELTMVMRQGYYPFYEGVYVIKDNVAVPQNDKPPVYLDQLRETITDNLKTESNEN